MTETKPTINVLIADDHELIRVGLKLKLSDERDIAVCGLAEDGEDALAQMEGTKVDIAMLDVNMPKVSGIATAREICRLYTHTRVIILSVLSDERVIRQACEAGALGYLTKDSSSAEIAEAIRTVYRGEAYFSGEVATTIAQLYRGGRGFGESPLDALTPRELEVLKLVADAKSTTQIAELMQISPKTVETHRARLMKKTDLHSVAELVRFAIHHGVTPAP